jgi:alpha/beta superfamily hydrolase
MTDGVSCVEDVPDERSDSGHRTRPYPDSVVESRTLVTDDGVDLEAELVTVADARAGAVLCHPHPQYGGSMRSMVTSALFEALPAAEVTTLRFNFRGVEGSGGTWDGGNLERVDVEAAIAAVAPELPDGAPLVLVGWSFGADMALSVRDPRVAGWVAIAPPLRFAHDLAGLEADTRPKLVLLAQHDEFRPASEVEAVAAQWANTETRVIGGASHFFVGRTDRLVETTRGFFERLTTGDGARQSPPPG